LYATATSARHRYTKVQILTGQRAFYPAAALYAAVFLPLSILAMGTRGPLWHAHEMLFGFALAVVAGNQLGTLTGRPLYLLAAAWAAARIAFLAAPWSLAAGAANVLFAALLALHAAPRLFGAAKKWRNQALPATLVALCASAVTFHFQTGFLATTVLLFALLMLFMGGRLIAPAVAGQLDRQGIRLVTRVQPRIEGVLIAMMALAVGASLLPGLQAFVGIFSGLAGVLAGVRLWRWRLWALRRRPDLLCLASGYAWLAFGLVAYGAFPGTVALHFITVGAIGTLTFNVMALAWLLRARRDPARSRLVVWGTLFIAAAALLRAVGHYIPAALAWSAAFALLVVLFAVTSRTSPARS
jgi:uncharacterized protein involved in response to NO